VVVIDREDAVAVIAVTPDPECEPALDFDLDRVGDLIRWRYLQILLVT